MEDLFGIDARRRAVADNIQKALGAGYEANPETPENAEENIQKGRVGVYEDNAKNRRLNRVGQQYGKKKEEEQPKGKTSSNKEENRKRINRIAELNSKLNSESGLTDEEYSEYKKLTQKQSDVSSHAAKASDGALKRAAADEKAPEDVRNAAKEELKKRGGSEDKSNKNKKEEKKEEKFDFDSAVDISDFGDNAKIKINGRIYKKLKGSRSGWIDENGETINEYKFGNNGFIKPSEVEEITKYNQDEVMSDDNREYMPTVYKGLKFTIKDGKNAYSGNIGNKKVEFVASEDYEGAWEVYVDGENVEDRAGDLGRAFRIAKKHNYA